jgi:coenzyme F420-0:L-glutamate ligase/coenzyme F420-1:gamma-L-glutamate ligase
MMTLTLTALPKIPLIQAGDDLADVLLQSTRAAGILWQDSDVVVLAQKIVSKAEGRMVNLATVTPSPEAFQLASRSDKDPRLAELILQESRSILRTRPGTVIVEHKLGFVCANAGIDHSNVCGAGGNPEDWVLLLPKDPDQSAATLRQKLEIRTGCKLGVLIIDSHGRAWRMGTVGIAIGLAGLPGLADLRGQSDLFGFHLRITQVGVADELAAAASLLMGQAAEGTPAVHVRGFPYPLREANLQELIRPKEQDLFR